MTDMRILFYKLGRTDCRKQYLSSYALEAQSSFVSSIYQASLDCGERMFTAVGVLVDMRGIIQRCYKQLVAA